MHLRDVSKAIEAGQVVWSHFPDTGHSIKEIRETINALDDQQLFRAVEAIWRLQQFSVKLGDTPFPFKKPETE